MCIRDSFSCAVQNFGELVISLLAATQCLGNRIHPVSYTHLQIACWKTADANLGQNVIGTAQRFVQVFRQQCAAPHLCLFKHAYGKSAHNAQFFSVDIHHRYLVKAQLCAILNYAFNQLRGIGTACTNDCDFHTCLLYTSQYLVQACAYLRSSGSLWHAESCVLCCDPR